MLPKTHAFHATQAMRCTCSPELELRQSTNERPELLVAFAWQCRALHVRIYLRCQKTQKEIEAVYSHGVRYNIEPLDEIYSDAIENDQSEQRKPSGPDMRHTLVHPVSVCPTELPESIVVC